MRLPATTPSVVLRKPRTFAHSCNRFNVLVAGSAGMPRHDGGITEGQRHVTFGACTLASDLVRLFSEFKFSIDAVSAIPQCSELRSLWA